MSTEFVTLRKGQSVDDMPFADLVDVGIVEDYLAWMAAHVEGKYNVDISELTEFILETIHGRAGHYFVDRVNHSRDP
jgi:hypothetical protein